MPVQLLGCIRVVMNIDRNLAALFETKQRAGKLAIVCSGRDDSLGRDFDGRVFNVQCVVCPCLLRRLTSGTSRQTKTKTWQINARINESNSRKDARTS